MTRATLVRLLTLLVLAAVVTALFLLFPVKDAIQQFLTWVETLGPWGPVLIAAIYVPATVLLVPGTLLSLAAGTLFGLVIGTIAISIGSTVGASAAFLLGRSLARGWVERKVAADPRFRAIDQAVAREGFKIVLLLRLSPAIPFNLLNYALALTRVSFRDYVLASWLGMLPGTIMYVYLGTIVANLGELFAGETKGGELRQVALYVGLVVTVVATLYITHIARKALRTAISPEASGQTGPGDKGNG
jgi:uncharacterized membrane protein YdjX (TVP38/TMEM64 family)